MPTSRSSEKSCDRQPILARCGIVLCLFLTAAFQTGCSRMFWRSQADFDAYNQLLEKTRDPRWDLPRVTVEADPRSRFFDGTNPDMAPLPPDDPAAHVYMHVVDGMKGYKSWHKFGDTLTVENPQWLANFDMEPTIRQAAWERSTGEEELAETAAPPVPTIRGLTLEQAIELANIHSREYQTAIEQVFLSSLLLTFDRFQFNVRYLGIGGGEPTSNLSYINTPGVRDDVEFNNRFGVSQLLPTGGQWAMELANNTLWLFSGDNQTSTSSLLSYSITQPLLLGAGRKIVLENLTQSERAVLYDVRILARFRKIFFGDIVVNGDGGGFLGLLRQQQQVNNQRGNIKALAMQIERLREISAVQDEPLENAPEAVEVHPDFRGRFRIDRIRNKLSWLGEMDAAERDRLLEMSDDAAWRQAITNLYSRTQSGVVTLDLAQLLTRLSSQENSLRDAERQLLDSIDQYKLQLGLPTDFQLTLNLDLLKPFQLIDPRIDDLEQALLSYKQDELFLINDLDPTLESLRAATASLERVRQQIRTDGLDLLESDFQKVDAALPTRLQKIPDPADRSAVVSDLERNRVVYRDVVLEEFSKATLVLQGLTLQLAENDLPLMARQEALSSLNAARDQLLALTQSLRAVQAGLRSELLSLTDFEMTQEEAVRLAMENRLDLMNARAVVMDARRQMEVAANRLEAVLNVVARGDIGTSGGNKPFDFRGDQSTFQAGIQFTAPLDQVLERNNYRQSQVAYQRARRAYMLLEDNIKLDVRSEWRQLQVLKQNFETARQNLRIASVQLDSSIETSNQPASMQRSGGSQSGTQGLNLLNALQSVLNAQNDLIRIWVQYEQNRINIHRDMDIMQVDERGIWIDEVYQNLGNPAAVTPTLSEPTHDATDAANPPRVLDADPARPLTGSAPLPGVGALDQSIPAAIPQPAPATDPDPESSVDDRRSVTPAAAVSSDPEFVLPVVQVGEASPAPVRVRRTADGWRTRVRPDSDVHSPPALTSP